MAKQASKQDLCVCDTGAALDRCCGPILAGERQAETAVALMRSRYAAFVLGNVDYLLTSWHPQTRPSALQLDPEQRWLGLKIKRQLGGQAQDAHGQVEFVARYKLGSRGYAMRELSSFERVDGCWRYLSGEQG